MIGISHEKMSDAFEKFHLEGLPFGAVLHRFGEPDHGDPHDHPWGFRSIILYGGYVEEIYDPGQGLVDVKHRRVGDSFEIAATHIHRITRLPRRECWTLVLPKAHERTSRFWQFREDAPYSRAWNEQEWTRHA